MKINKSVLSYKNISYALARGAITDTIYNGKKGEFNEILLIYEKGREMLR